MPTREPKPESIFGDLFSELLNITASLLPILLIVFVGLLIIDILLWLYIKLFLHEKYDQGELNQEPENRVDENAK